VTETKPKRRWFRFSLRTLFVLVTIVGIWLGLQVRTVMHRKQMLAFLDAECAGKFNPYDRIFRPDNECVLDGPVELTDKPRVSFIRRLLGDRTVPIICLPTSMTSDDVLQFTCTFPDAFITQFEHTCQSATLSLIAEQHFEITGDRLTVK
jgi:hypothetical protein